VVNVLKMEQTYSIKYFSVQYAVNKLLHKTAY